MKARSTMIAAAALAALAAPGSAAAVNCAQVNQ
jgi:hypothetical protein